jgi:hypothetical protein
MLYPGFQVAQTSLAVTVEGYYSVSHIRLVDKSQECYQFFEWELHINIQESVNLDNVIEHGVF